MGKVICPEPGVQMTIGSTTIPNWRERVSTYKTPTIQEEIAARDFEIDELRAALASERERCARLCEAVVRVPVGDGTYHEMYMHLGNEACAEAIRAPKKEGK